MRDHDIDAVLAKKQRRLGHLRQDCGRPATSAIEVVLVRRPVMPDAPFVATVEEAVAEIAALKSSRRSPRQSAGV